MKIALAQIDVIPNKPQKNIEKMLKMVEEAKGQNVDLIVFPEMGLITSSVADVQESLLIN